MMGSMTASALLTDLQWVLFGVLVVIALTALLSISGHVGLALAHDALPILLLLAWIVLVVAVFEEAWILVVCAAALCVYHLSLVLPRMKAEHVPRWAEHSPTLELVVSNVFFENKTPDVLVHTLLAADGDVMIITEWNDEFAAEFEAAGGNDAYPYKLCDESDKSDYAVCILSRLELTEASTMNSTGPLNFAHAGVMCGERELQIVGLNPTAVVDKGGYKDWKRQIEALIERVPTLTPPAVIAGDLNTTQFRPEFKRLLKSGLVDAHDSLGKGLSRSFKLAADGVLAAAGNVVRLDHALLSNDVRAVRCQDLEASAQCHHLPFRLTLAVRQSEGHRVRLAKHLRHNAPVTPTQGATAP